MNTLTKHSPDSVIGTYKRSKSELLGEYLSQGQAKIVVKARSAEDVAECVEAARRMKVAFHASEEVDEGTGESVCPCVALGPDRSSKIDQISGKFKLM